MILFAVFEYINSFILIFNSSILLVIFLLFLFKERFGKLDKRLNFWIKTTINFFVVALLTQYLFYFDARYIEPNWIQVKKVNVKNEKFTQALANLKIVQISDPHIKSNDFLTRSMIAKVNKLKPDLVLITGDFITNIRYLPVLVDILDKNPIKAKIGVYAVRGDNDPDTSVMKTALKTVGINLLDNENIRIPINDKTGLWLTGVNSYEPNEQVAQQAYSGVNFAEPNILLVHSPIFINTQFINHNNTSLVVVGDTHGGQIGIPFIRDLTAFRIHHNYISGLYNVNGVPLYVNRGIASRIIMIRLFCRPEITVFKMETR